MKKIYLLIILSCLSREFYAQSWEWAFQTKGLANIKSGIADDNSIYLTGNFHDSCNVKGTMFYGVASTATTLLIKLSSTGNLIWSRNISSISNAVKSLQIHHNDVYIGGNFQGNITGSITDTASGYNNLFIVGFSTSGNVIFYKKECGGGPPWGLTMEDMLISKDQIFLTGRYYDSTEILGHLLPLSSNPSIYLAKYDLSGTMTLLKTITGFDDHNQVYAVRTDQVGNIYLHVHLQDTVNITSDTNLFLNSMAMQFLMLDTTGKFRNIKIVSSGYYIHLKKFTAQGNFDYTINLSIDGGCGTCNGGTDISRMDSNSSIPWTYSYGGNHNNQSMSPGDLSATDNFVYFTGRYAGAMLMGNDSLKNQGMYLAKLDHNGNYQFAKSYEYYIYPQNLSNAANRSLIVTGTYGGAAYLGSSFLDTAVSGSCFVAKFYDPLMTGIPLTKKENSSVSIYPNPSHGIFTIKHKEEHLIIRVFNIYGQLMLTRRANSSSIQIDLSAESKGIYFIEMDTGKERLNKKIVLN